MASLASPFRRSYRYMQRAAHEQPVIFYSIILGGIGPVLVIAGPYLRPVLGIKPIVPVPTSYPLPNRPRRPVQGYDDE